MKLNKKKLVSFLISRLFIYGICIVAYSLCASVFALVRPSALNSPNFISAFYFFLGVLFGDLICSYLYRHVLLKSINKFKRLTRKRREI